MTRRRNNRRRRSQGGGLVSEDFVDITDVWRNMGWVPPAVGLVPEDFYGRAVDITDIMVRFKLKNPGRVVRWGVKNDTIPADLWVDINAADMKEAQEVAIKLVKWLGRNGCDVIVEEPLEAVGPNTWRFKCRIKAA